MSYKRTKKFAVLKQFIKFAIPFMEKLHDYDISFSTLKPGLHGFELEIKQEFLNLFNAALDFKNLEIIAYISLMKHSSFLELEIKTRGEVNLNCDISNEEYQQPVENSLKTLVKFGDEFDDTDEEVLILPFGSHSVNVAQLIYESVLLSIPMKHIHPKYQEGYKDEHTNMLDKYSLPENE